MVSYRYVIGRLLYKFIQSHCVNSLTLHKGVPCPHLTLGCHIKTWFVSLLFSIMTLFGQHLHSVQLNILVCVVKLSSMCHLLACNCILTAGWTHPFHLIWFVGDVTMMIMMKEKVTHDLRPSTAVYTGTPAESHRRLRFGYWLSACRYWKRISYLT